MSAFGQLELQKAVYAALSADTTLATLVTGVYDYVNSEAVFPYVVLGGGSNRDHSTKTTAGAEISFALHVYSREGGHKETLSIMERLHAVLHQAALSLTGHTLILMRFDGSDVARLSDGLTYHGAMRFRALTESD
jgi:hypothetical protein